MTSTSFTKENTIVTLHAGSTLKLEVNNVVIGGGELGVRLPGLKSQLFCLPWISISYCSVPLLPIQCFKTSMYNSYSWICGSDGCCWSFGPDWAHFSWADFIWITHISVVIWQLGRGLAGRGWLRTFLVVGWLSLPDDGGWLRHMPLIIHQASLGLFMWWQDSKRGSGNLQGLLRSTLGTGTVSLLSCSVSQGKSQGQARFKMWEDELCLLMGGSALSHCSWYGY